MSDTVLLVVHGRHSNPGQVATAIHDRGWHTEVRCPQAGQLLPETMDDHAGVVIFGGPMSANDDELSFIRHELDWIPTALDSGKPFFGICLGAQLLARSLGATVAPHPKGMHEIGYFPLKPAPAGNDVFPEPLHVMHWHNEGNDLPDGADLLATGDMFQVQAFRYGTSTYGVQFHPEMRDEILRGWMRKAAHKLSAPGAQPPEVQYAAHARYGAAMHRWLDDFIGLWLGNGIGAA